MNSTQRFRLSVILMVSGLVLLLILEGLWLNEVYKDRFYELRRETNRVFFSNIRDMRDSLYEQFYEAPVVFQVKDSMSYATINITRYPRIDTTHLFSIVQGNELKTNIQQVTADQGFPNDTLIRLGYRRRRDERRGREDLGALSLYVALTDKDLAGDSLWIPKSLPVVRNLLKSSLGVAFNEAGFPLPYDLVEYEDSIDYNQGIVSYPYRDLPTGVLFAVRVPHYRRHILGVILPEIIFSVLLFVSISLAFILIIQYLQRQRRLAQIKDDFISNVTHELKTPITTVGVAIEALSNFHVLENPERTREYLDISKLELNRLGILVDRVLKMAQFETSEPELKMEWLDLKDLIQGILNSMKLQFEKLAAHVSFDAKGEDFPIKGDRIHLTSVIYNLLDNALKYSPSSPEINIALQNDGGGVTFSVADRGMGIAQEYLEKIFDKFFRVPTGDRHDIKGYGLGLSYVANVVRKHQGTIKVDSSPGIGTVFTVYLPADQLEEDAHQSIVR